MKSTREALIAELMAQLSEDEQAICRRLIECLSSLDYTPYRERVRDYVLSFKNNGVGQTIAKIGIRGGKNKGVFYSLKFYACKNPPEKYIKALHDAVTRTRGQYECCDCGVCGAAEGERGYRCVLPDGNAFLRCGAYAVEIPGLMYEDTDDVIKVLSEQHAYFEARMKKG